MTMPETTQSDLVERLTEMAALYRRAICDDNEDAQTFADAAAEITRLRAHCKAMAKALHTALDLLECIEQRSADNMWWVNAFDPETACGDAYHAVDTALAAYRKENPDV